MTHFVPTKIALVLTLLALAFATSATAQMTRSDGAVVIGNDRGGVIRNRLLELQRLRASGQTVRIEGDICYSTCTMLIGLPTTCVSASTTFGFHGPSQRGRPMNPTDFEIASRTIANHYPPALRDWYLATGRHEIQGIYKFSGADLIRYGVRGC